MSNLKNVVPCCIKVFKQEPDRDGWYVEPTKNQMIDKLLEQHETIKKYETIEQELGIPLEVLFKALKDGIWTNEYEKRDGRKIWLRNYDGKVILEVSNRFCFDVYYPKDYGKTWALTREELDEKN